LVARTKERDFFVLNGVEFITPVHDSFRTGTAKSCYIPVYVCGSAGPSRSGIAMFSPTFPVRTVSPTASTVGGLLARGDEDAFRALWSSHRDAVYRFACWVLQDGASAEDVVQDCFIALIEHPEPTAGAAR